MVGALTEAGWLEVAEPDSASVILVNSCGFIEPAQTESIEAAFEQIGEHPDARVVMTGCLAQRFPEELAREMPELAGVFGNRRPEEISSFLRTITDNGSEGQQETQSNVPEGRPVWHNRPAYRPRLYTPPGTAHLKIAEGCNHNCAFCAIPQIRGTLRSRPIEALLREFRELIDRGVGEVNLIAQDLSLLGTDKGRKDFLPLLQGISGVTGDFWVRLLYIYPEHFPLEVLDLCNEDPRILPYFDLPVQHASPKVLRAMGRPATPDRTLKTLNAIKERSSGATVRTTFLVGYPGEGESEFRELLAFQQQAQFDWMGAFVYSPQEGTKGLELASGAEAVPQEIAEERARLLYDAQATITSERLSRFVGREEQLLVEERVEGEDLYFARGAMQAPEVDGTVVLSAPAGSVEPGAFCRGVITGVDGYDLRARRIP